MSNAENIFGPMNGEMPGPILFLLLFVISAAMMAVLVFGRPVIWFLDGAKKEAVMLTLSTVGFLILIAVVIGSILFLNRGQIVETPRDATYTIEGFPVTLKNGLAEDVEIPTFEKGTAVKVTTIYFGNETRGDFDGDGFNDVAVILRQETDGTGIFYYLAVALGSKVGYRGTNAILLGDRIAPQTTEFRSGQIIANYADRRVDEPMAAAATVGISKYFEIVEGSLIEVKSR